GRIAVTGRSGSGKSTLLHLMAGLEAATAGVISWPGLGGSPVSRPGTIGLIFQGPSLLPALNALENVTFPLLLAHTDEQQAQEQAWAAMHALRFTELATKLPQELSGGQAQRVAVARALAGRPALILADEPTGQLDSHTAAHVMDVLLQAADDIGAGLLVSTHDPLIADRLPTRWDMSDGRIVTAPAGVRS
ncbi:MAG: ATP-binding cassette domain-containing protein, partial [Nakamurella sp.]